MCSTVARCLLLLLACVASSVTSHAVLTAPTARAGMANGVGIKVTPFATALTVANAGCGGAAAGDRGPGTPVATWTQGSLQQVSWKGKPLPILVNALTRPGKLPSHTIGIRPTMVSASLFSKPLPILVNALTLTSALPAAIHLVQLL